MEVLWEGEEASASDVDLAIFQAKEAVSPWSAASLEKRMGVLENFKTLLEKEKASFTETIAKETGKTLWDSEGEVNAMIAKVAISRDSYLERCPERRQEFPAAQSVTRHKPHGVLVVFGPFNFPGHLPGGHIIPALLAGNSVVFKPSELTPLVGELLVGLFHKAGVPKQALQLLQGGKTVGKLIASHPQINGLLLTGSWDTGKALLQQFATHPEKILALELGGNNPLVVSDIDHMDAAVYVTLQSAFITAGQRCTCARRLILIESPKSESYLEKLIKATASLKVGAYDDKPEPFMGAIISLQAKEQLLKAQESLIKAGAHPLVKMGSLDRKGIFISPGILDVTSLSERKDQEHFGPLLQVIRVKSFQEALEEAKKTQFGLTAGLLSTRVKEYHTFYNQMEAGIINWNTPTTGASSRAPFGGLGHSGNFRPSAYYAADYCSYPIASMESRTINLPKTPLPGITL